jgi:hypothetical protein
MKGFCLSGQIGIVLFNRLFSSSGQRLNFVNIPPFSRQDIDFLRGFGPSPAALGAASALDELQPLVHLRRVMTYVGGIKRARERDRTSDLLITNQLA